MKTLHLLMLLLCNYSFVLVAQNKSLLHDPKIEWLGETTLEYFLEEKRNASFEKKIVRSGLKNTSTYVQSLKLNPAAACGKLASQFFTETILDLVTDGTLPAFSLDTQKKLSTEEIKGMLYRTDTVITFDPASFEEAIQVITYRNYDGVQSFKIKQRWFIRKGTDKVEVEVMGIIPMHAPDKLSPFKELFFIPMESKEAKRSFNFDEPDFVWIKGSVDYLPASSFKTLKGNIKSLEKLLVEKPKKGKVKYYDFNANYFCLDELDVNYFRDWLTESVDTIIMFEQDTTEEQIQIVRKPGLGLQEIAAYRTIQMWYYDEKTKQLKSYLKGMGPVMEMEFNGSGSYKALYSLKFE